jgi:glycine hydroxymethyltransferase
MIGEVLDGLAAANAPDGNTAVEAAVKARVLELCRRFPIYQ